MSERPITHRLENIGEGLFRAMVVINETAGDEATTQEAAGFSGKPELTNRWFRAYRFALAPGESTPKHRHTARGCRLPGLQPDAEEWGSVA